MPHMAQVLHTTTGHRKRWRNAPFHPKYLKTDIQKEDVTLGLCHRGILMQLALTCAMNTVFPVTAPCVLLVEVFLFEAAIENVEFALAVI